ncbi:sigma-E processing peptidase SpoIIGA [Bacillus sp. 1NLA3E]|uniref:sigma-E processing peptidase SpoIIGA n=1 Tax=Bacillus sp. 1NLA3E TaxID=666686 RepID=UPI000247E3D6|nr:sigma-E processing peptidase SpoIIGA [Bacillus sp. 1NLA3E]AGK52994.1 sigma-E processing peptidase SpoIIGA [Bacillus sp. 1NLA3E]
MTVYLDVIWALNLLFDSLLLLLTAIILKRQISKWRIFLGGLLGSVIILLAVTPLHVYSGHPISKLLFSIFMVLIVFGYKRFRYFITGLMTFYFTTFLIGGALIGTHYFVNFDFQLSSSVMLASIKGFGDPISWLFVLLGFPIAWHFSHVNIDKVETAKLQFDNMVKVFIFLDEMRFEFRGLVDSGNQLYDPITKSPVMLVSVKNSLENLSPPILQLAQNPDEILFGTNTLPEHIQGKMKIIPCKVMGREHQLIIAIKPDKIVIEQEQHSYTIKKGLVSFTMQELSSEDAFQCIVHPKMLSGPKDSATTKVS